MRLNPTLLLQPTARARKATKTVVLTVTIYTLAILYFSPILYMLLSGFKTEYQAVSPSFVFTPTLETYQSVLSDASLYTYLGNSIFQNQA